MLTPRAFRTSGIFFVMLLCCVHLTKGSTANNGNGFIENKGQVVDQFYKANTDVLYQYCGNGIKIQLRKQGYSYELFKAIDLPKILPGNRTADLKELQHSKVISHRVDVDFMNCNQNISVAGTENSSLVLNYVIDGKETYDVGSFKKVVYSNVYDHIDIEFLIDPAKSIPLKYNIILHPGANSSDVKLLFKGAESIFKNSNGEIEIKTSLATVSERIPFSYYQNVPDVDHPVEFELQGNVVSFKTSYDNSKTLVIDPSSNLIWGNYIGGNSLDYSTALCTFNNLLYKCGYTLSTSNIATAGVHQTTLSGSFDSYLVKYTSAGVMVWGTYFGGTDVDAVYSAATDSNGNIFVGGDTFSTSNVASPGSHQPAYGGGIDDAMLFKFNSFGQRLWSTYYGGSFHDIIGHLCVDVNDNVFICGHTESSDPNVMATAGAYQTTYASAYDVFVAKFSPLGVRQWGTYFGDTGADEAWGIDTDPNGDVYVSGFTASLFSISTPTAHQTTFGGGNNDCFVIKLNSAGTNLIWGTYYGGNGDENGTSVEVAGGKVFLVGTTTSSINISSASSFQTSQSGAEDGFLVSFNTNGARLWGTYYGGVDADYVNDLFLDANNDVLFCGQTLSQSGISTGGAYQASIADPNNYDAFFVKFNNTGARILGSYFGGTDSENSKGIVTDTQGKLYLSGETQSTLGISTPVSTSSVYLGSGDAFLAKFCITNKINVSSLPSSTICMGGPSCTLTAPANCQTYSWSAGQTTSFVVISNPTVVTNYTTVANVVDVDGCTAYSDTIQVYFLDCTGLQTQNVDTEIRIYPNPANNTLFFRTQAECKGTMRIYDLQGKMVLTGDQASGSVDISNLPCGMYILELNNADKKTLKKFVKE
jgi:hypothetical protein